MNNTEGYGVVYTPFELSEFVARILLDEYFLDNKKYQELKNLITVVDPACGEGALLSAIKIEFQRREVASHVNLVGVDTDVYAIQKNQNSYISDSFIDFTFKSFDSILPSEHINPKIYWSQKISKISIIIANPPWSSEKIYDKTALCNMGYTFDNGQYDSYVLFLELSLKILQNGGLCAFIIPDSIFSGENKSLREYLSKNVQLRVIARLGEKLFPNINRATSILIIKKSPPNKESTTKCFRLNTEQRKEFLSGKLALFDIFKLYSHTVLQSRFSNNANLNFDIDTHQEEEQLLRKIEIDKINWNNLFHFGRGVEISKKGDIVTCPECGTIQAFSSAQMKSREKVCIRCHGKITINNNTTNKIIFDTPINGYTKIYVGENIQRYQIIGEKYIKMGIEGINYKDPILYMPPKILVRKTGLGLNACIDYGSTYINQTVYSCNFIDLKNETPLEYYLGILNSRLLFYYYLKVYGENEWKSHPYVTKDIIFSLPLKKATPKNYIICNKIAKLTKELMTSYSRDNDLRIEALVSQLYKITSAEQKTIMKELDNLPNLSSINNMKF